MERPGVYREFIVKLLIASLFLFLLWALWSLRTLLIMVFGAIVIAVLLNGIAAPVSRRTGLGTRASTALVVLAIVAVGAVCVWLFGAQMAGQFAALSDILPKSWTEVRELAGRIPFGTRVLDSISQDPNLSSRIAGLLQMITDGAVAIFLIFFGAIFLAAQPKLYREGLLKLIPAQSRSLGSTALDDSGRALRLWVLGQLISMVVVGFLTGLGLWWAGVPSPIALGVIAGLTEGIPYVGPIIGAVPGLLIALTDSPTTALWALLVYVAVQQIEGNTLVPIIQRRMVSLPPALTVFWIIAAGLLFGVIGLVFAAPLLVVAYVLVKRLYVREVLDTATPIPGEDKD